MPDAKNVNESAPENENKQEMGFLDHIDELRKRIIWSLIAVLVFSIAAAFFVNHIMEFALLQPAKSVKLDLQNLKPFGQPFLYFKVIFVIGIICAFPFILFQLWKFVAPGLYHNERKWVRWITFFTSFCFLSGVVFSYFVIIPMMLKFAASFGSSQIKNIIDINEYFSFISMMLLASGLLFEMPMVAFVLSRFGIITPQFMKKYRRHAIVIILILAAVLTPTPDPISQLIFASPLFILYEISILISKIARKQYNATHEINS